MNFAKWILKRIANTFNGGNQWEWIRDYRRLILREKPLSIVITLGGGLCWFIASAVGSLLLLPDRESIGLVMKCVVFSIPAFYIYNWLAALHEIYRAEVMRTFDTLKETE